MPSVLLMICTAIGAFVTFFYLLNTDYLDVTGPVEKDPIMTYPQSIAVGVVNQRLDVDCVGHVLKRSHRVTDLLLMIGMQPKQLLDGFSGPVD